jgi:hypothetical protein
VFGYQLFDSSATRSVALSANSQISSLPSTEKVKFKRSNWIFVHFEYFLFSTHKTDNSSEQSSSQTTDWDSSSIKMGSRRVQYCLLALLLVHAATGGKSIYFSISDCSHPLLHIPVSVSNCRQLSSHKKTQVICAVRQKWLKWEDLV